MKFAAFVANTFVAIHPMQEGNGRTARSLFQYYISKYLEETTAYSIPEEVKASGELGNKKALTDIQEKYLQRLKASCFPLPSRPRYR